MEMAPEEFVTDGLDRARQLDLTHAEKRLHDIMRLVSDWVWETDDAFVLIYVSPRVTEALSFHPAEITGRPLSDLAVDPSQLQAFFGNKRPASPFRGREIELRNRQGGIRRFKISGVPVFCPKSHALVGYRGTAQDITDLLAHEEALRMAVETAETANRTKSEFLANTSHELRTPLNAIIGFTEIMHSGHFGPIGSARYRDYLGNVLESAQHLLALINDILDVAKVETGKIDLEETLIDPADVARQALCLVAESADRADISLRQDIPQLPRISADGCKIKQILLNLLSNAIKFTPSGGTVELSALVAESGEFTFRVTDTGIGIACEDQDIILTPFGQVDSQQRRKRQGTGLGLPLCNALTKLHGGRLDLQSVLGEGTVVAVVLPAYRVIREVAATREKEVRRA